MRKLYVAAVLAAAFVAGTSAHAQAPGPDAGRIAGYEARMRANYNMRFHVCLYLIPVTARAELPMSRRALRTYVEIARACWTTEPNVPAGFALARFLERTDDQAGADEAVRAVEARFPESALVLAGKAGRAARAGNADEANTLLDQAIALGPARNERDPDSWTGLTTPLLGGDATLPLRLRIYDEAWRRADARRDRGDKVRILNSRAYVLLEAERHAEALADLDRAMPFTNDSDRAGVLHNRARAKRALGDAEGATTDFAEAFVLSSNIVGSEIFRRREQAAETAPGECSVAARQANGFTTEADGDVDAMMAAADECIAAGHAAMGLTLKASERSRLGDRTQALALLDEAVAADPSYAWAFGVRGATLQAMERYADARAAYDQAIVLSPQDGRFYFARAALLIATNDREAARADQETALRLEPRGSENLAAYVRNLVALGDHRCAVAAIDAAERLSLATTETRQLRAPEWRAVTRAYEREERHCPTPVAYGADFAF